MSKKIDLQIEKSRILIDGLRKNIEALRDKGIESEQLDRMVGRLEDLRAANETCESMRAELSVKVREMNAILNEVKESFVAKKRVIKVNYPQEEWIRYGVQDKR